jgi:hypothetical protein
VRFSFPYPLSLASIPFPCSLFAFSPSALALLDLTLVSALPARDFADDLYTRDLLEHLESRHVAVAARAQGAGAKLKALIDEIKAGKAAAAQKQRRSRNGSSSVFVVSFLRLTLMFRTSRSFTLPAPLLSCRPCSRRL